MVHRQALITGNCGNYLNRGRGWRRRRCLDVVDACDLTEPFATSRDLSSHNFPVRPLRKYAPILRRQFYGFWRLLIVYGRKAPDVTKTVDLDALRMFKRLPEGDLTTLACVVGGGGKSWNFPVGVSIDTPSFSMHASLSTARALPRSAQAPTRPLTTSDLVYP